MPTLSFIPLDKTLLYIPSDSNPAATRTAFLLPDGYDNPPASISLADSLQQYGGGVYLFFTALPYSTSDSGVLQRFIQAVRVYLRGLDMPGIRFFWIQNPAQPAADLAGQTLRVIGQGAGITTARTVLIQVAPNIALAIGGGTSITPDAEANGLLLAGISTGPNVLLVTPGGGQRQVAIAIAQDEVTLGLGSGDVPMGSFGLGIAPGMAELASLDVGLRYFSPYLSAWPPGYLQSFRYPLFNLGDATLPLTGLLDPLDALNPARTYFTFSASTVLGSYFSSVLNSDVTLTPQASARLVFAMKRTGAPATAGAPSPVPEPYYLTPSGDFTLRIVGEQGGGGHSVVNCLACGSSGVEYITLPDGQATATFIPGQNAYAPARLQRDPADPTRTTVSYGSLSGEATTSWAYVHADSALSYYAQPDSAVLHQADGNLPSGFLGYLPLLAGQLLSATRPDKGFPLVPYKGLQLDPLIVSFEPYRQFEAQVLNPARRNLIYAYNPAFSDRLTASAEATQGTTPQGLLLTTDGSDWLQLLLAQSTDPGGTVQPLTIQNVNGPLKAALQSNQLFLVISSPAKFMQYCANPTYRLTAESRVALEQSQHPVVPPALIDQVWNAIGNVEYAGLAEYESALKPLLGADYDTYVAIFVQVAIHYYAIASYKLTVQSRTDLEQSQDPVVPAAVISRVWSAIGNVQYGSLQDYEAALKGPLGADYNTYLEVFIRVGALFSVYIEGWRFDLSPYFWSNFNTILIFKFINAKMQDLVRDTSSWAQAAALNDDVNSTRQQLQEIIAAAQHDSGTEQAYFDYFNNTVVGDANWNGILALRCRVPLSGLPAQIEGIAAGINPNQFFAHHLGVTVTPVAPAQPEQALRASGQTQQGGFVVSNSSLFGLIRYDDPGYLTDQGVDYQFKVLSLNVLFQNSGVSGFASQIDLLVNRLFAEPCTLLESDILNNITLDGVYQQHGSEGSYVFASQQAHVFSISSRVLSRLAVARAQFVTIVPQANVPPGEDVRTRFLLWGALVFQQLPGFDLFSFGGDGSTGLGFTNLAIDMQFPPDTPSHKTFTFDAQQITLDPATSVARPDSLYNHFPLKMAGLMQAQDGVTPPGLGYMPVDSPLIGSQLAAPWFGLVYDLNLGSLGALAGQAGFVASLLLGWQPDPNNYRVYIGLRIPGASGGKREINFEGVIKLTFGDLRFVANAPTYILQIRNIALHLLSLSFPPGQTDIVLFGDPNQQDNSTLGWYAAYKKANDSSGSTSPPRLRAGQ